MPQNTQTVTVDGRRITLTNLDKVLYPATGTTKADVIAYYTVVSDALIAYATDRPATRKRWVHGIGTAEEPGQVFFQKNLDESTPAWVKHRAIEHRDHINEYPLVNDLATLTWLGQIAALEIHVPQWKFGRTGQRRNPDRLVLDLDPGDGASLADCAEVARYARTILTDMGLDPLPVTSGSKGIHLYAALDGKQTSEQVSLVAHELARALEADHPDVVVSDMKKSLRRGKVLVDWSQNNGSKTTITPYSLRGRTRPTVAAPRTWEELASTDLAQLEYEQVLQRVTSQKDPLAALVAGHLASLEPTPEHMASFQASVSGANRLREYRAKRDASKTPEPMPDGPAAPSRGTSFVIQEHHARRLHHDFRLEHDGVLVSWALPKGMPTDTGNDHLAVQTEDHPLDYGTFEGRIPEGEYGAGEVSIWDSGEYDLEKWRADEVIVTLRGEPGGGLGAPTRVALIRTGGEGKAAQNWLIHLMKDSPSVRTKPAHGDQPGPATETARRRKPIRTQERIISPMLATLGNEKDLAGDDAWAFEMKWDGIRAIAYVGDEPRLLTRNGNDVTASYPELVDRLRESIGAESAVLDGEIVATDKRGRPDFGLLQTRMGLSREKDVARAARSAPVQYLIFDLLEDAGASVTDEPYDQRRRRLERLVRGAGPIQVPPAFEGDFAAAMRSSRELGLEGIVAKKRDSTYSRGRRSRAWIKVKHHLAHEVVIGGWRPGHGRRSNGIGSLLLGIPEPGGLRYVGRVGTGFSDRELDAIAERLAPLARTTMPFSEVPRADSSDARWVTAELVGEVEFSEWTATRRLRQASWRGFRSDKRPEDVAEES